MVSVLAFFLMASGYTMLEKENDQLNMWVPTNHPYRENNDWLQMNKPASKVGSEIHFIVFGFLPAAKPRGSTGGSETIGGMEEEGVISVLGTFTKP